MTKSINIQDVLNCPMEDNDSGANTIRGYLIALLTTLWEEGEGFQVNVLSVIVPGSSTSTKLWFKVVL